MPSVPSKHRPIPLERRGDLVATQVVFQGISWWVLKDPVALQYHRLRDDQFRVLQLLDGQRSLEGVRDQLRRECPTARHTLGDLQRLVTDFHRQQLVRSNRMGQGGTLGHDARRERRDKLRQKLLNPLSIQLPGWDVQRLLDRLLPWVGWIFHPAVMLAALGFILAALGWLTVHFDRFRSRLPEFEQFFGWPNLIYMWAVLAGAKILHEFGHGLSCRKFGAESHEMGVMLLVFSPALYCDVTDSWMLKNKWERIIIGAAGMYVEAILSAFAVILWWNTADGLVNHLCLNLFFVTTVTTVIFNANPLMRFDGYYMLSDYLEIPNLRPKADQLLQESFAWVCLGIEPKPDPFAPERGRHWFILFALIAWVYRWFVVFGITYFLCTVLKPHGLQSVGMSAAVFSLGAMAVNLCRSMYRTISAPREEPMNRTRMGISLALLGAFLVAALFVPLPLHVTADFVVEPQRVEHVYATVPGRLVEMKVRAGDRVARGDVLAVLENPDKADRRREVQVKLSVQQKELGMQRALGDSGQAAVAQARVANLTEELAELDDQLRQLTLVAPCDGTVVAPERQPEPKLDTARSEVGTWYGTPLEPQNIGCWLEARAQLLSLAPNERFDAVLLFDQADRDSFQEGGEVSLKLEHRPNLTITGTIREVSRREEQFAPHGLSVKQGGSLTTTTDASGRERLTSPAYQAIVPLDYRFATLPTGLRGKARLSHSRSAASWAWRTLRQTLHFRL